MTETSTIPAALRAGDSWSWTPVAADYPGVTWTLAYTLVSVAARATLTATWDGSAHRLAVTPTASAAIAPGWYTWTLRATRLDGETVAERVTLDHGAVQILPDPATVAPSASGSHARRMLAAIEACLEQRANEGDLDLVGTAAGGRSAQYDLATLIKLRSQYAAQVASENAVLLGAAGGRPGQVQVRFN